MPDFLGHSLSSKSSIVVLATGLGVVNVGICLILYKKYNKLAIALRRLEAENAILKFEIFYVEKPEFFPSFFILFSLSNHSYSIKILFKNLFFFSPFFSASIKNLQKSLKNLETTAATTTVCSSDSEYTDALTEQPSSGSGIQRYEM